MTVSLTLSDNDVEKVSFSEGHVADMLTFRRPGGLVAASPDEDRRVLVVAHGLGIELSKLQSVRIIGNTTETGKTGCRPMKRPMGRSRIICALSHFVTRSAASLAHLLTLPPAFTARYKTQLSLSVHFCAPFFVLRPEHPSRLSRRPRCPHRHRHEALVLFCCCCRRRGLERAIPGQHPVSRLLYCPPLPPNSPNRASATSGSVVQCIPTQITFSGGTGTYMFSSLW